MSEERFNIQLEAEMIVNRREFKHLLNLSHIAQAFEGMVGKWRQKKISQDNWQAEMDRLDTKGKWSTENDLYDPPRKKKKRGRGYDSFDEEIA